VSDQPIPSSPLIAPFPEPQTAAELQPWPVTRLVLAPERTLDLLCACAGKETLVPGVIIGITLSYWAKVLQFAGTVVAREQFLPGISGREESPRARWEPVLMGPTVQRMKQLAKVMPPACRAFASESTTPPDIPAETVLSTALEMLVDMLVRSSLGAASGSRRNGRHALPAGASIHDRWLHALQSSEAVFKEKNAEQKKLTEQISEWRRSITVTSSTPFRLCFRLEEPEGSETAKTPVAPARKPWHLRYLLQAADDPSLLVSVADACNGTGRKAAVLRRASFHAREYLLSALGQAAAVCPLIEESLKTATPAGADLDASGAHGFLMEKAWLLEQAGFGVLLPAWWSRKGTKVKLTLRAEVRTPKLRGSSGLSLDEIVRFDWKVAIGAQELTLQELETLAKLKAPLVNVRGQWVQLSAEEIQAALDFWKRKGGSAASAREIVQMALGGSHVSSAVAFGGVDASGWIGDLLAKLESQAAYEEVSPSERFQGALRPYQGRGLSWLSFLRRWGLGACLADDMGLGKTVQTLALIQRDWQSNGNRPTLLICPMSVVGNWQKEAARFTPDLPVLVHRGQQRLKGAAFKKLAAKQAIVLSSFALLHRDFPLFEQVAWAGVILDEAQNIKNAETKQAQAARSLRADYRIALTGTPVENHVGDLWSIMEFLNPGLLGTRAEFKRNFFVPIQATHDPEAAQRLKRLTGPFLLRRLKTDKTIIADLPEKLEMKVFCTLTKEQASLYAAVVEEANTALKGVERGIQRKGVVLATLSKLKQVCNHPAQFLGDNSAIPDRSGKLARLTEMLEEALEAGDKALIFTQFTEMGAIIKRHLQEMFGREVLFLHGGVTKKQRDLLVARFQGGSNGHAGAEGPRIFVLSLKAGGTGLNLTAANHVFHFDRWWNPAVENQATDRAFRIGQTRNVQVHKFLCVGTLEEKIDEMIESKQEIAAKVVGTGEGWLTELSNRQLKELFTLRQGAVAE